MGFNPRSPRGGATIKFVKSSIVLILFQSTLPTRGSDFNFRSFFKPDYGFNPRSPRGGATYTPVLPPRGLQGFNPRSPRGGATHRGRLRLGRAGRFNPRSPRGGATQRQHRRKICGTCFNPRSPRGGATAEKCICMQHFREFTEYYPLRHGDACCIAPQDCIIQAFFGAKKRCFYVRLCFALKNKGVRG